MTIQQCNVLTFFVGDSTSEMLVSMAGCPLEDFYPAVAISALMRILKDANLSNHHTMVIQAVTLIFKSLGMKCVQFVPQVDPRHIQSVVIIRELTSVEL